ncbi:4-alpha-glucanotransferase [Orrella sp. JC864]|uniref:4-alpha-glucanotransferase n=1 Tax=Orrella sp. JC864 TaxID=3120298 RepID=UPI003009388F
MTAPADDLAALAQEAGLLAQWTDARRRAQQVPPDTLRRLLGAMGLPADTAGDIQDSRQRLAGQVDELALPLRVAEPGQVLTLGSQRPQARLQDEDGEYADSHAVQGPDGRWRIRAPLRPGYHRLEVDGRLLTLAVAPPRCPPAAELLGEPVPRRWGVAAQVYSLRQLQGARHGACGYGDFAALARLAAGAAAAGADALAISPVHAGFASAPERYSPYSPSSRLFLNVLYGSPGAVLPPALARLAWSDADPGQAADRLESGACIDWQAAAACRMAFLLAAYRRLRDSGAPEWDRFERFCRAGGAALRDHARYEGLAAHHGSDWRQWPQALRDPRSAEVAGFAAARPEEVEFHLFAQWVAAGSLDAVQRGARQAGMRIGLVADLAIGTDPRGSQAWSDPDSLVGGACVGAPPDLYNPLGQDWGLTAFSSVGLRQRGYAPFIAMLRAALAHAGGVRIDHVLGLSRMWLVPEGAAPTEGAYLRYPMQDLFALVRLEAWRHRALVVGENLGTVPEGFDQALADAGILGIDVLWFKREEGPPHAPAAFLPPARWSPAAVAVTSTHDLPTLRGWWQGRDIDWRTRLGLLGEDETEAGMRQAREAEKAALWQAVRALDASQPAEPPGQAPEQALLAFAAAGPSPLALVPLEDLAGEPEQPNLPGTLDEHPNWRQRMRQDADTFFEMPAVQARLAALARGRARSRRAGPGGGEPPAPAGHSQCKPS